MSDKSERAYWWIDARANRLSRWIDGNRGRLLLIAIFAWLGVWGLFLEGRDDLDTVRRLIRGMGPELAGIVIAAVTIDTLAERRLLQERKAQLIRQMGSTYRDVTEMAIIELKYRGWLYDGSLRWANLSGSNLAKAVLDRAVLNNTNLSGANLSKAILWKADLRGALAEGGTKLRGSILEEANLSRALLHGADLSKADLGAADLRGADLSGAILNNADLTRAKLSKANLDGANLRGVDLWQANLSEVWSWTIEQLEQAKTLEGAIMPDGVQLGLEEGEYNDSIEGPTFEEWKALYIGRHGGTVMDERNTGWFIWQLFEDR